MSVPIVYVKPDCKFCELLLDIIHHVDAAVPPAGISQWNVHDTRPYPSNVSIVPSIYDPEEDKLYPGIQPTARFVLQHLAARYVPEPRREQHLQPRREQPMNAISSRTPAGATLATGGNYTSTPPQSYAAPPPQPRAAFVIDRDAKMDNLNKSSRDLPDHLFNAQVCDRANLPRH